jgi:hypothetical protein
MLYTKNIYQDEERTYIIDNRHIIGILMDSPFYFNFSVRERKKMVERIKSILR